ncbi:hypothetical protein SLE2022_269040 [Rubroshorea leprosula]
MELTSVAIAVKVDASGGSGGNGSRRAVRWAAENLKPDLFVLVHVMPAVTSIPTPSGDSIPITELDENVVTMYVEEMRLKFEEALEPFKKLLKRRKIETLVLEDENPATGLLRYISESGINSLVLGSCASNYITRKLKGPGIPETVLRNAPETCEVYVVSRSEVIRKSDCPSSFRGTSSRPSMHSHTDYKEGPCGRNGRLSGLSSCTVESIPQETLSKKLLEHYYLHFDASPSEQLDVEDAEVEQLRMELQNTITLYKQACEELVHTQKKVELLSSECLEESRRVNAALEREETFRKIATEEKAKHLQAMKEVEEAKCLLAKEAYERQIAEVNALKESLEKQKIADALFSSDKRYRRYAADEIEVATDFFSRTNLIGEGSYGKVYHCNLHHTPVAVKVLQPDAVDKRDEFLNEVEVLSRLHHPNIVLLLGACPENGCLVYEYLENGSLEEYIFRLNGKPPLPWFIRFRIAFEVASGLAFLHNSKPEPIVHRDVKPDNILLNRNYVSKIADVGMAKLLSDVVPDNITEYRDSILAGTLSYMDPEYQRTGTVRPKSDLYAFGVTTLQLLTGRHPNGLIPKVENAIKDGSLAMILDNSVSDWPLAETEKLARVALKCSKLRCRDRPDLDTEVLPILKRLADVADRCLKAERNSIYAPSHYFCPILQEIMDDPYVAADGFTYEHRAIKAWLEKHNVSPVTKHRLQNSVLTPNHILRTSIQEWKSRRTFSSALI